MKYNVGNIFGFSCVECEHNRHCYGGDLGNKYRFCQKSIEKLERFDKLEKENQKLKKQLNSDDWINSIKETERHYIYLIEKENQELKSQLDFIDEQNKYIDKLEKEVKELKELNIAISKGLKKVTVKRNKWRNRYYKVRRENGDQQKEFMEYLEDPIRIITEGSPINITEYTSAKLDTLKEVLQKYKEIIGGKDE